MAVCSGASGRLFVGGLLCVKPLSREIVHVWGSGQSSRDESGPLIVEVGLLHGPSIPAAMERLPRLTRGEVAQLHH
eukprot:3383955-Prymnesium_polylepis.3